jgi:hypothetical protein
MPDLYLSFDVETDGRSPAKNSMISLGVAAFCRLNLSWHCPDTFKVNIKPREGYPRDQLTYDEFWSKWPAKLEACSMEAQDPAVAMETLFVWLDALKVKFPTHSFVWVAGPVAFDWQWLNFYYYAFCDTTVRKLHYAGDCLSTLKRYYGKQVRSLHGQAYRDWSEQLAGRANADPHDALQDAIHQGWQWVSLLDQMNAAAA